MSEKVFIIAEAGVNHDGSLDTARRLIDAAKEAGADAVKFQMFNSRRLWGDSRIAHLELSEADMILVAAHARERGIEFMCTPFGVRELEFLTPMLKRIKIASGCIRNYDLLYAAYRTGLPVILSTGMSTLAEVKEALALLPINVTLLHCTSAYPCEYEDVNLLAIDMLRKFKRPVGYSDHTLGIIVAVAAAAKGAAVIEKHLTLNRNAEGPDHNASIEPREFCTMVDTIRLVEVALGDGVKRVQSSEAKLREVWEGVGCRFSV